MQEHNGLKFEFLDLHGRILEHREVFRRFVELYDREFSDPTEREDPRDWARRLTEDLPSPQPITHLVVAGHDLDDAGGPSVFGGIVFEYYRVSSCGLLTYVAVDEPYRHQGLARILFEIAIQTLEKDAITNHASLQAAFGEAEDPRVDGPSGSSLDTRERLCVMEHLGAKWVDIPYVQPALSAGGGRCGRLLLLCFHAGRFGANTLEGDVLIRFLFEFYQALGITSPQDDPDFHAMVESIDDEVLLKSLRQIVAEEGA